MLISLAIIPVKTSFHDKIPVAGLIDKPSIVEEVFCSL
jgi:hypothetical protein